VIRAEPERHASVDVGVEVVHQEQAEDRDVALAVRESSTSEAADGLAEKILAPTELLDMITWSGIRHHSIPGPHFLTPSTLTFRLTV
jgi:hypothetical protein